MGAKKQWTGKEMPPVFQGGITVCPHLTRKTRPVLTPPRIFFASPQVHRIY